MKKIKLTKEIISRLENDRMDKIKGGTGSDYLCTTYANHCLTKANCPSEPPRCIVIDSAKCTVIDPQQTIVYTCTNCAQSRIMVCPD